MRKVVTMTAIGFALMLAGPAMGQHIKTNGSKPNPIREYGKFMPTQHIKTMRSGSGAHRAQ